MARFVVQQRISWDDGHESIYTPAAGALGPAAPAKRV
jgi:hypothetical protein